jgi:DNA-binding transcriptional MerR regulator
MAGMDNLLQIGRFARLAGLSVGSLRHYDELDLLRPARIDPSSGYRFYRHDQLDVARQIVAYRDLEVPLETVRELLATDDPAERRRLLRHHRSRVEARTARLQRVLHILGKLSSEDGTAMTATPTTDLDPETRRHLAASLFNHVWTLLENPDRTPQQDDEMLHAAHASRFHWGESGVGEPVHHARGEWQCSRVYAVLGRPEPALWHAHRCLALVESHGLGGFDLGAAYEAVARAQLTAGDLAEVGTWKARAAAVLADITDPDDREILEGDLATLP